MVLVVKHQVQKSPWKWTPSKTDGYYLKKKCCEKIAYSLQRAVAH